MYRSVKLINSRLASRGLLLQNAWKVPGRRNQSNNTSGGKGKLLFGLVSSTAAVVGGSVGYASYDPKFRSWLEVNVPASKYPLKLILGPPAAQQKPQEKTSSQQITSDANKARAVQSGLLQKKKEREAATKKVDDQPSKPSSLPPVPSVPAPPIEKPVPSPDVTKTAATALAGGALAATAIGLSDKEKTTKADNIGASSISTPSSSESDSRLPSLSTKDELNEALDKRISELVKEVNNQSADTVEFQRSAARAVRAHTDELQKALAIKEEGKKKQAWNKVTDAQGEQETREKQAKQKVQAAEESFNKLRAAIDEGRSNRGTATNPNLTSAEESLNKATYNVHSAQSEILTARADATVVSEYKDLVEKNKLLSLTEALTPFKPADRDKNMTPEQLNGLIDQAYKQIELLQRTLNQSEIGEQQRLRSALDRQRKELEGLQRTKIDVELTRQRSQLGINYQKKESELRDEHEEQLRQQLRRQTAAHNDHLHDVLELQHRQLQREYERETEEKIADERGKFIQGLSGQLARVKGIEEALKSRSDLDKQYQKSQLLYLACLALQQSIRTGDLNAASWEEKMKPLQLEVQAIKEISGPSPYVEAILNAIPEESVKRGVLTEDALRERFITVHQVARKLAMIDDNGGSLLKYGLSYVQSMLITESAAPLGKDREAPIDPSKLGTFEILARARACVDRDDLQQAAKYLNLLKGAPRQVARDWLKETRLLLETKQAADALLAHASATGVQAAAS